MASAHHNNVFVYGTLLADEVLSALLHRVPSSTPACLPGFHRYSIKGRIYPAILPQQGSQVYGKVLFGITEQELELLDDFEDVEYTRQIVEPQVLDANVKSGDNTESSKLQSYAYIWADFEDEKLYGDWNYENWRSVHLDEYTQMCSNYEFERLG